MVNLQLGVNFVDMKFSENVKFAKISTHNLIVTLRYAQASDPTTSLCSGMRCRMGPGLDYSRLYFAGTTLQERCVLAHHAGTDYDDILSECDGVPILSSTVEVYSTSKTRRLRSSW